jgi:MSHA biogenesis protein MshG
MAVFAYKGRNAGGELQQGTLEGDDSVAIAEQLIKQGITPTEIKPSGKVTAVAASGASLWQTLNEKKIDTVELMLFSRQMHTLLRAGVPIMRALAGLQESSENPALAAVLQSLRESLDSGRELSAAMRLHPKVFSTFYDGFARRNFHAALRPS